MIVRVHRLLRADRFAFELAAPIRDDLVRVRIGTRARSRLENIEREMLVELALCHFLRGLDDERAALGVEQTEIVISLRCRPF